MKWQCALYICGQTAVDFSLQFVHHGRVGGQVVQGVGEGDTGGLVASVDENESLGQNLVFSQTYKTKRSKVRQSQDQQTRGQKKQLRILTRIFVSL